MSKANIKQHAQNLANAARLLKGDSKKLKEALKAEGIKLSPSEELSLSGIISTAEKLVPLTEEVHKGAWKAVE